MDKNQENQDMVSQNAFRPVLFGEPTKRATANAHEEAAHIKRARLDSTIGLQQNPSPQGTIDSGMPSTMDMDAAMACAEASPTATQAVAEDEERQIQMTMAFKHTSFGSTPSASPTCNTPVNELTQDQSLPQTEVATSVLVSAQPKPSQKHALRKRQSLKAKVKKFRSRSLPNILFTSRSMDTHALSIQQHQPALRLDKSAGPPPLPPVNIQSLREIDLGEILKNPQLRHDILFDPQLQFRPNLDGERGRRKKITYDKYWSGVRMEIESYFIKKEPLHEESSRLPNLFNTLKEILISLLPSKDKESVTEILDIDLIVQQLSQHSLDFVGLATWLSDIFKSHCAPMRDSWVDEMITLFNDADSQSSVSKLVEGLRLIFTILEAMKLDVANHQIRMLRPVLVQTAVDFERDYFTQMISRCKLSISDSIEWFKRFHQNLLPPASSPRDAIVPSILSLLSCSHMVSEFPSSLAFDHARLIVLRANVRQVVCLQLCLALYRQLVNQCQCNTPVERSRLLSESNLNNLKKEVLAIITDDNGNVKWTRNIAAIALQLVRRSSSKNIEPKDQRVDFAFNWLIKQTQPSSPVYSLMEQRVFKLISEKVADEGDEFITPIQPTNVSNATTPVKKDEDQDDISGIASRIALLTKFHWSVFGSYYTEAVL
jgi:hypothetical protein